MKLLAIRSILLAFALAAAGSEIRAQSLEDAQSLHAAGELDRALEAYGAVVTESADPIVLGTAHHNACLILLNRGDYRSARPECESALGARRGLDDPRRLARTLNNLGLVLQYLGESASAEQHFLEALGINRDRGDVESQVINRANLGVLAAGVGDYGRALAHYAAAEELAHRHLEEPWAAEQVRVARINQGVVMERVGAYREALELYRLVIAEEDQLDAFRQGPLNVNVGVVYRNLGDPVSAITAFESAIASYERLGDPSGLSNAYLNLGLARHLNLGDLTGAESAFREALRLAVQGGDRTEEIQDLFCLGRLLLEMGRLAEAEELFHRCLALSEESGSAEGRWSALEGLARIAEMGADLHSALARLREAMDEIEQARAALDRSSLRADYFRDKRSVYGAAVRVLHALANAEPEVDFAVQALEIAQRAKARELVDAIGGERAAQSLPTMDQIRARLGSDVALEFFVGEDHLYSWTIRGDEIQMRDLGPARPVLESIMALHRELSSGQIPSPALVEELSATLLPGAEIALSSSRHLYIAPDGRLHYLPFEVLEDQAGTPLLEAVGVSYLASVSALARLAEKSSRAETVLAAFAAPSLPELPPDGEGAGLRNLLVSRFRLQVLPAASREVARAADLLPGRHVLRIGEEATKEALSSALAEGARVVHLATHTVVSERLGQGTAILLSPTEDSNGLLFPEEIARLDYRVDLTVLSSCQSALGGSEDGRAFASLTGAFLAAGSTAVLATLWPVGDAETASFMEQFYFQLGRGRQPGEALRRAKQQFRSDPRWSNPSLWAGYVLVGEAAPIVDRRGLSVAIWVALALGALLALWLAARRLGARGTSAR